MYRVFMFVLMLVPMSVWADAPGFLGETGSAHSEASVHGHEEGLFTREGLTGGWGGARAFLENHGLTLEGVYTGEFVHNFAGGAFLSRNTIYEDNLDLSLTVDTEKLIGWTGGTLFVYGLRNHGGDPSADMIGDLQTASNIEAPDHFAIQELWYEQTAWDDVVSLLFGLHDLNSEFDVSEYGSLFINSSFGITPEISGNVPTSIFPKAGATIRLRVNPVENFYVQAAVYDGDPATRRIKASEGKMMIAETGLTLGRGTYKLGYWFHSADKVFNGQSFKNDYGIYMIADQNLMKLDGDAGVSAFLQWGWVPRARNEVAAYLGGGLHMHGVIPGRREDDLGIAVANAATHVSSETTLEVTWRWVVMPWLAIQPSFQWIRHPGGDSSFKAAKVGLLRFEVTM